MKKCLVCGREIIKTYKESKRYFAAKKYCSRKCFGETLKKPVKAESKETRIKRAKRLFRKGYCARNGTHPIYNTWKGMRHRCMMENNPSYKNYGGRGIRVCDEWQNDFSVFLKWALENHWEQGLTLERINNDGDYKPSNCKWITRQEQLLNTRRNRNITYNGKTQIAKDWARELGLSYGAFIKRLNNWDDIERVFNEPKHIENIRNKF